MPDVPDLRRWEPSDREAKNVDETSMLNTTAREPMDTVDTENKNIEDTNKTPQFGPLGARGRK